MFIPTYISIVNIPTFQIIVLDSHLSKIENMHQRTARYLFPELKVAWGKKKRRRKRPNFPGNAELHKMRTLGTFQGLEDLQNLDLETYLAVSTAKLNKLNSTLF